MKPFALVLCLFLSQNLWAAPETIQCQERNPVSGQGSTLEVRIPSESSGSATATLSHSGQTILKGTSLKKGTVDQDNTAWFGKTAKGTLVEISLPHQRRLPFEIVYRFPEVNTASNGWYTLSVCESSKKSQGLSSRIEKPFCTDGCTRTPEFLAERYFPCCVVHDAKYWRGGSDNERREADAGFRFCIQKRYAADGKQFDIDWSTGFNLAVTTFGDEYWGAAWNGTRENAFVELTPAERALIDPQMPQVSDNMPLEELKKFSCKAK